MKHRLALALVGSLCVAASPASAGDSVSILPTGQIASLCLFDGQAFSTAGITSAGEPIAAGETATSLLNLADSRDQAIGSYRFQCNTPSVAVTITTINDFKLINPVGGSDGEIPYLLKVPGLSQLASGFTTTTAYQDAAGPGLPFAERQLLVDVGTLNLFNLAPGFYTDQVIVTIQPSL